MRNRSLTRRRFLAGCATAGAAAAVAGAGAVPAFAAGGDIGVDARPDATLTHTICQGCPNACGYTAYVVEGNLGKVIGDDFNPNAQGTLCARGFGFTQSAFSEANLTNPLRRKGEGDFQTISWDEAFEDISQKLQGILDADGPGSVALIHEGLAPTAAAYGSRFMAALGSANVYVDDAVCDIAKEAAFSQVLGVGSYTADISNADLILLVDTSFADITTPDLVAALQEAREAGTPIVAIDPRMGALASMADQWVPVNPGTELALLLAICNEMIQAGRYDKAYVQANAAGFDEWAAAIAGCTSQWAEPITGVADYRIDQLAAMISDAAPRVAVEYGNGLIGAGSYVNGGETARTICLLNMLAGAYNAAGGALLPYDYSAAALDTVLPRGLKGKAVTVSTPQTYDLGAPFGASAANALEAARTGALKALFLVEADVDYDYQSVPDVADALSRLELLVAITQQMTQTAELADYVLPIRPYLACESLPAFVQGQEPAVAIASAAIGAGDTNALPVEEVLCGLGRACGASAAFDFTLDEAAQQQLAVFNVPLSGLKADGTVTLSSAVERLSAWPTEGGRIRCTSPECTEAGLSAAPVWVPPLQDSNVKAVISADMNLGQQNRTVIVVEGGEDAPVRLRLISGQQSVLGSHGYNVAELVSIADTYNLDSVWINTLVADLLGVKTGDTVTLSNQNGFAKAKAFVTQRIVPTAVFAPSGFGRAGSRQHDASAQGFNPAIFSEAIIQDGYGTLCTQEACVTIEKVGE